MSLLDPRLEAFMAIVACKTVHGAAEIVHITQTAVTQRIRSLESQLKTTLFIRSRRGMALTQEGAALIRYCNGVKSLEGQVLASLQGAAVQTEIEMAITAHSSMMSSRIIPNCIHVLKKFPFLTIRFEADDMESRYRKLKMGQVDFAVIRQENLAQEMSYKTLEPEEYILVCTSVWKNRKLHDIISTERIIDFDPRDEITFNYLKEYNLFDKAQHPRLYSNRTETLTKLVIEGLGYSVLSKEFARQYIEDKSLIALNEGKTYNNHYILAWYPRHEPPEYFASMVNSLQ